MKRKKFTFITFLIIILFLLRSVYPIFLENQFNLQDDEKNELIAEYPTDAVATFAKSFNDFNKKKLPIIYIKSSASDKIRLAEPRLIENPALDLGSESELSENQKENRLGFVIPQLERGTYTAWYGNEELSKAEDSFVFKVKPVLIFRKGVLTDNQSEKVRLEVGISSTFLIEKNDPQPKTLSVPIRLKSLDPDIADLDDGQSPTENTDKNGFASWMVKIKTAGTARFIADSPDFESVRLIVEGKPKASEEIEKKEELLQKAEAETAKIEDKATILEEEISKKKIRILTLPTDSRATIKMGGEIKENEKQSEKLRAEIQTKQQDETLRRNELFSSKPTAFLEKDLLPGDVFLVLGSSLPIGVPIVAAESVQLGTLAEYSHAALYIGEINNQKMVAEMQAHGYVINTLAESRKNSTYINVFRWKQISPEKRKQIAETGKNFCGNPEQVIRTKKTCSPYAYLQIGLLGVAAAGKTPSESMAKAVDFWEHGTKKMICSEFVARVYEKNGLKRQTKKWWISLEASGILNSLERRLDYTTPNMLSISDNFEPQGRLE